MPNTVTIKDVYELIERLEDKIESHYVSKAEFGPVKIIVFGMVGLILSGVMTALVATVIRAKGL